MQLYFIRHAQSNNNALWQRTGSYNGRNDDPELTETGRRQIEWLARFLAGGRDGQASSHAPDGGDIQNNAGFGLTHLYTSLMVRAIETATAVASTLDLPLSAWTDLHEGGGVFLDDEHTGQPVGLPGKSRSCLQQRFPEMILPDSIGEDGWWNRPFETRPERRERGRRVLADLIQRHGGEPHRVAVISHGGFYNHFLAVLLGLPERDGIVSPQTVRARNAENLIHGPGTGLWFTLNNVGITRIDFLPDQAKIMYQNRLDFLPRELIT